MHRVIKVIILGSRNQSIETFAGKLVLESDISMKERRELGNHGEKLDVAELNGMRSSLDVGVTVRVAQSLTK